MHLFSYFLNNFETDVGSEVCKLFSTQFCSSNIKKNQKKLFIFNIPISREPHKEIDMSVMEGVFRRMRKDLQKIL